MTRHQRKHVARHHDVARALGGIDRGRNRVRTVMRGDAGGNALLRFDGDGERRLIRRAVELRHHRNLQRGGAFLRQRQADEAAAVFRHEIHGRRRAHLRRNHEIAFVLAVLGIDEDEHAPVAGVLDQFLDGGNIIAKHTSSPLPAARHSAPTDRSRD